MNARADSDAALASLRMQAAAGVSTLALQVPGSHSPLLARLYTPAAVEAGGLIVFFPGGGFVSDELDKSEPFMQMLATRTGYRVLGSGYTLAGSAPFPAAAEDAYAVLAWAYRRRALLGWSGERLINAGIEAGGNLAAVSALLARDRGGPALAAQLLIMPMLDAGLSSASMRAISGRYGTEQAAGACASGYRCYLQRASDRIHPYASPLQSRRLKGLPPALVLSADDDPLRDEAEQYAAKLIAAGIKTLVKRMPPIGLENPDARCGCVRKESALREIACFIGGLEQPVSGA